MPSEFEKLMKKQKYKSKTKNSIYDNEWSLFLESLTDLYDEEYVIENIDNDNIKKEFIKTESVDDVAILSKVGYLYTDYFLDKNKRKYDMKELNDIGLSRGYKIDKKLSEYDIMVFYNKEKKNYFIVHRGTQPQSRTGVIDILTDMKLFFSGSSKRIENRLEETEDIIKIIKRKNPKSTISLGGHSLGSTTSSYAMTSPLVLNNVDELVTINGFYGGLFDIFKNNIEELKDDEILMLNEKTTHHRMQGDIISSEALQNVPFGDLLTYEYKGGEFELKSTDKYSHDLGHFLRTDLNPVIETTPEMKFLQENLNIVQEASFILNKELSMDSSQLENTPEQANKRIQNIENMIQKEQKAQQVNNMLETINKQGFNSIKIKSEELKKPIYEGSFEEEDDDLTLPFSKGEKLNIDPFSLCKVDPSLEGCENFN